MHEQLVKLKSTLARRFNYQESSQWLNEPIPFKHCKFSIIEDYNQKNVSKKSYLFGHHCQLPNKKVNFKPSTYHYLLVALSSLMAYLKHTFKINVHITTLHYFYVTN